MNEPLPIVVQLVHIHGPMKGDIQEFDSREITIGRHPSSDLQFPRDLVVISRNHACIKREGNRFKILDISTNGTFVNGARISESWLKNGDVIFFTQGGPKVSFLTREGVLDTADQFQEPNPPARQESVVSPHRELQIGDGGQIPVSPSGRQPEPGTAPHADSYSPPPFSERLEPIDPPAPLVHRQSLSQGVCSSHQASEGRNPVPRLSPEPIRAEPVRIPLVIQYGAVLKSFNALPITLGKGPDCDFALEHPSISGPQVQIFFSQGSYRVKDLTGTGQVVINNQSISSPAPLVPNDQLFLTPKGPGFLFIEGGRMAEISISEPDGSAAQGQTVQERETHTREKPKSLFGKLFR